MPDSPTSVATPKIDQLANQYLNLVYCAAVRQLGPGQSADDVTQAVFLIATQKAHTGRLPEETRMAGWLLKVTHYAVKESRRAARRRSHHEQAAAQPNPATPPSLSPADTAEIQAALDDALLKLRPLDREAILRRYLQDAPIAQVAAALGLTENTTTKRLTRALEKLRKTLARRGIIAPAAAVAALMLAESAMAAPTGLAASVAGLTGGASVTAVSIAKGATVMMKVAMMKAAGVAVCLLLALSVGVAAIAARGAGANRLFAAAPETEVGQSAAQTQPKDQTQPATQALISVPIDELRKRYTDIFSRLDEKAAFDGRIESIRKLAEANRAAADDAEMLAIQKSGTVVLWNKIEDAAKEIALKHGQPGTIPEVVPVIPKDGGDLDVQEIKKIIVARMVIPLDEKMAEEVVRLLNERYAKEKADAIQPDAKTAGERGK